MKVVGMDQTVVVRVCLSERERERERERDGGLEGNQKVEIKFCDWTGQGHQVSNTNENYTYKINQALFDRIPKTKNNTNKTYTSWLEIIHFQPFNNWIIFVSFRTVDSALI